ncbi:MAG: hypothetical protein M9958_03325 [Chitinophagales bacterium]|nr:hypothetical protein [Chitinophagales bacterium]
MIFTLPLQRNGYYYMSNITFNEYVNSPDRHKFHQVLLELNAIITTHKEFRKISIPTTQYSIPNTQY